MKKVLLIALALTAGIAASAQKIDHNHCCGSYMPYDYVPQDPSPVPDGYKPFYISHFGRHGSRYHSSEKNFVTVKPTFDAAEAAGLLTEMGKKEKKAFEEFYAYSKDHFGALSEVGRQEHKAIAFRMAEAYPEVIREGAQISAISTSVPRVKESMSVFCKTLDNLVPGLAITKSSDKEYRQACGPTSPEYKEYYSKGPWKQVYSDYEKSRLDATRLVLALFKDESLLVKKSEKRKFAESLFALATGTRAAGSGIDLFEPFTEEEIYTLWEIKNVSQYFAKGPSGLCDGVALALAAPILKDMIEKADKAVAGKGNAADLRFGHGEGIMPLAGLMGIEGASTATTDPAEVAQVWNDWKITCLGANIQMVFYKNAGNDVIVRVMLNERTASFPIKEFSEGFYRWKNLKKYFESRI